ncbi:MAG: NnrU family protein [Paracoccaceae bacterium]
MTLLILGLLLWSGTHFLKRLAPAARASMQDKIGEGSKGVIALLMVISIVMMVIGYRGSDTTVLWDRSSAMTGINNLLMIVAVALMGVNSSKSRFRGKLRHGMLSGVVVWAAAHLLVNGDIASIVLFGGLAIWAIAQMLILNRTTEADPPFEDGTAAGDIKLLVITLVLYVIISGVHTWLGYLPFG